MEDNEVKALAAQVVKELADDWTVDATWEYQGARIRLGDARLFIHREWRKDTHIEVSATWPDKTAYYFETGEREQKISVRADRGAKVIAREITRRLLPGYFPVLAKVVAADERSARNHAARDARVAEIRLMLGMGKRSEHESEDSVSLSGTLAGYGKVHVSYDGSAVSIETGLMPAGVGLAILRCMRKV